MVVIARGVDEDVPRALIEVIECKRMLVGFKSLNRIVVRGVSRNG